LELFDRDNVAQYFIDELYDAIVPGKHDFYFGPERLRELANLLENNQKLKRRVLAANITDNTVVAPDFANAHPRIPERLLTHPYHTDFKTAAGYCIPV
jgi:2',3'-cyclic-nucleotide 2'-phosphodiesterase (5'-nucleotidase family)